MFSVQGPPISPPQRKANAYHTDVEERKGKGQPCRTKKKKKRKKEIVINLLKSPSVSPLLRLPHGSVVKSLPAKAGDLVLIPGSRKMLFRRK